jgi:hypothetical protein
VRERAGMKMQSVRAAIRQLLADRELVARSGPRNGLRLFLAHAAPPEEDR